MMKTDQQREEFRNKKLEYEKEKGKNQEVNERMKKNDGDTLRGQLLESSCESSNQFVIQTLWMFPTSIFIILDARTQARRRH